MTSEAAGKTYMGTELDVFAHARRWKAYWARQVAPYLRGDVLEVGAGLGANTALLLSGEQTSWTCLEPDADLARRIEGTFGGQATTPPVRVLNCTVADLAPEEQFDAALYVDVLEHIEDDQAEIRHTDTHLRPGGHLIVVAPAHQSLFTEFDRAIGHYRRYSRASLAALIPDHFRVARLVYLDSVGLLASSANRLLLHQALPTLRQILAWDRLIVPASRVVDRLVGYRLGKSVVGVWQKQAVLGGSPGGAQRTPSLPAKTVGGAHHTR
jgi:SAM-dependent methyltransferase